MIDCQHLHDQDLRVRPAGRPPDLPNASPTSEALAHLDLLASADPAAGARIELRLRDARTGAWSQRFLRASDHDAVAGLACDLADTHDVYVGVLLRQRDGGRRRDLAPHGNVAWVDFDTPTPGDPLDGFAIAPSLVVASGTPGHRHAYWRLDRPVDLDGIEAINRSLALRLGGDLHSGDAPRILRLAGSRNHKTTSPTSVRLLDGPHATVDVDQLRRALDLPEHPVPSPTASRTPGVRRPALRPGDRSHVDQLEALLPADYVAVLTGQSVPKKTRKVRCPLHEDDTASLHVYETPAEGWFCFGCRRGGTLYDLAAAMCGRQLRGPAFVELQRDLVALLVEHAVPQTRAAANG